MHLPNYWVFNKIENNMHFYHHDIEILVFIYLLQEYIIVCTAGVMGEVVDFFKLIQN